MGLKYAPFDYGPEPGPSSFQRKAGRGSLVSGALRSPKGGTEIRPRGPQSFFRLKP